MREECDVKDRKEIHEESISLFLIINLSKFNLIVTYKFYLLIIHLIS